MLTGAGQAGKTTFLEPWFRSFNKRIVKTSKIYFRDSGLLCRLLGLDSASLLVSPFLGAVWETFAFAELRKLAAVDPRRPRFWYYRDQVAREIDLGQCQAPLRANSPKRGPGRSPTNYPD